MAKRTKGRFNPFAASRWEYVASLLLPLAVLLVVFAVRGLYPFGDTSLLLWDMDIQYVGYFGWLSDTLRSGGNLFYSASKGLGGDTLGLVAYYLSSPLNIIAIFFDSSEAPKLISWLTLVKIPLAGLTAYIFLRKRFHAGWQQVLLACSYALCGFVLANCSNIMWLDGVIMLPVVCLGVYRLVAEKRHVLLFVSVLVVIVANWYTAYMDCLFAIVYFVFCQLELSDFHFRGAGKAFWKALLRFAATMLLALGASMAFFFPAILSLMQGKGGSLSFSDLFTVHFRANPSDFFSWLCIGSTPASSETIQPAIYISAFTLVLAFAFLLNRKLPRRLRVASLVMACIIIAVFIFTPFEVVWSGFKKSTSFYFRFAFLLDFIFMVQASRGFDALRERESKPRLSLLAISAFLFCFLVMVSVGNGLFYSYYYTSKMNPNLLSMALQVFFTVAFGVLLVFVARKWNGVGEPRSRASRVGMVVCVVVACGLFFCEQSYSVYKVFGHYSKSVSDYETYTQTMQSVYDELPDTAGYKRSGQAGFSYRASDGTATTAESMVFGVGGYSHYSSTMRGSTEELICNLGLSKEYIFGTYYNSPLLVPDTLLGIDYIMDDSQPYGATEVSTTDAIPYSDYKTYRNNWALGLGYGVTLGAGDIDWTDDPFTNQSLFVGNMVGESSLDLYTSSAVADIGGQDVGNATTRTLTVTVAADGPLYAYTPTLNDVMASAKLSVNGSTIQNVGGRFTCNVVYLGEYKAGDVLNISLTVNSSTKHPERRTRDDFDATNLEVLWSGDAASTLQVETLDVDAFSNAVAQLDSDGFALTNFTDGSVSATFDASEDETLLMSVPYSAAWKVYVDGEPVETRAAYSGMIAVDVSEGQHSIEMRYVPRGVTAGLMVSGVSLALFVAWRLLARRRSHALQR